jgi:Activator of Hsp90 ATPase homolog 1-like protein
MTKQNIFVTQTLLIYLCNRRVTYKGNISNKMGKKNYKAANYSVTIELEKSPNDVFSHLIHLKKWWPEDFEGEDIKLNSEFILTFGDSHFSRNKVIEWVPNKKLVWLVTESIRKTDNFAKWWGGKDLRGNSTKLTDEFIIDHPGAHYSKQKLVEVIPEKKIVWLVTESTLNWLKMDQQEWTNTRMIFEITPKGDKTVLHFTHEGLFPKKEYYPLVHQGWNTVIKDYLFHFITDGKIAEQLYR